MTLNDINASIFATILADLRTVADGGVSQAQAYASLRDTVPTLFPIDPTQADIKSVTNSPEWLSFDKEARTILATAYFNAPRMVKFSDDTEAVAVDSISHPTDFVLATWSEDNKAAKSYGIERAKIRKAAQDYVRVAFRQNVSKLIPRASDAPEAGEKVEALPDPTGTLALVTEALRVLSEKNPAGAVALLNGLDGLVKYARPYIAEGKPMPA